MKAQELFNSITSNSIMRDFRLFYNSVEIEVNLSQTDSNENNSYLWECKLDMHCWNKINYCSMHMSEEFVISSFLSCHNKHWKWRLDGPVLQLPVTAQFHLESKGKHILEEWGWADPKDTKRREAPGPILAPLFTRFFSSPCACPV